MKVIESFFMGREQTSPSGARKTLGEQLILLRQAKGWTQETAAEASGLGLRTLKLLESGGGNPELSTLEQIANAYGVTLAAIFEPWRMGEKGTDQHLLCKKLEAILKHPSKGPAIKVVLNSMYFKL